MKKAILALALVMSMGATQVSWASSAPKHRYHPATQQVDQQNQQNPQEKATDGKTASADQKASARDDGALEAYSDPTSSDSAINDACDYDDAHAYHSKYSLGNYDDPFDFIGSVFGSGMLSAMVIFCIIFGLLFVFAPLIIFILLSDIWFDAITTG